MSITNWNFDEDLGGTFSEDKKRAGFDASLPMSEIVKSGQTAEESE